MKNASKAKKVSRAPASSNVSSKKQKPLPFFAYQDEMEEILSVHLEISSVSKFMAYAY